MLQQFENECLKNGFAAEIVFFAIFDQCKLRFQTFDPIFLLEEIFLAHICRVTAFIRTIRAFQICIKFFNSSICLVVLLCCATKRQSVQINRTTLYLWHPSTLKAVIWCVATRGQTLLSQKISVQSDQWFLRYGQICVGKHTFSKSPKDAKN